MNQVKEGISFAANLAAWEMTEAVIRKASARPALLLSVVGAFPILSPSIGWSSGSAMGEALYPGK